MRVQKNLKCIKIDRKRIIVILLVCIMFIAKTTVCATSDIRNDEVQQYICTSSFQNDDIHISRKECISALMRIIGVGEEVAAMYAFYTSYDQPVFYDVSLGDMRDGYIIVAKTYGVAKGIDSPRDECAPNNFAPDRAATLKECLTFMLRCLTDSELIEWENIMYDSVRFGLLREKELEIYDENLLLEEELFYTLICRMLDKGRYLYWMADGSFGHGKMQIDEDGSVRYIDWIRSRSGTSDCRKIGESNAVRK